MIFALTHLIPFALFPSACLSWTQTVPCLDALAAGVRARRAQVAEKRAATRPSSRASSVDRKTQQSGDVSITGSQVPGIAA